MNWHKLFKLCFKLLKAALLVVAAVAGMLGDLFSF